MKHCINRLLCLLLLIVMASSAHIAQAELVLTVEPDEPQTTPAAQTATAPLYWFVDGEGMTHYRIYGVVNDGANKQTGFFASDAEGRLLEPVATVDPNADLALVRDASSVASLIAAMLDALPDVEALAALDVKGDEYARIDAGVRQINAKLAGIYAGMTEAERAAFDALVGEARMTKLSALNAFFVARQNELTQRLNDLLLQIAALPDAQTLQAMDDEAYETAKAAYANARQSLADIRADMTPDELARMDADTAPQDVQSALTRLSALFPVFEERELTVIASLIDGMPQKEALDLLAELIYRLSEQADGADEAVSDIPGETQAARQERIAKLCTLLGLETSDPDAAALAYINALSEAFLEAQGRMDFLTFGHEDGEGYLQTRLGERWEKWQAVYAFFGALYSGTVMLPELGPLTGDDAYVSSITVTDISDGIAPFDGNDERGNDSGTNNRSVRTFDSVTYQFQVQTALHKQTTVSGFTEARVKCEFVLPIGSAQQAEFDLGAMAWMDTTAGYEPVVTTETRIIDTQEVQCQVLTCYKHLLPAQTNPTVVPGSFGENVTIKVKGMAHGDTLQPIFSAAVEHGTWEGDCPTHGIKEKETTQPEMVKVTAKPSYNVLLKLADEGTTSWKGTNDYNTGNASGQYPAANYGIGSLYGRTYCYGLTVMLYNVDPNKGLKGIELPKGDITFQLKVASQYTTDDTQTHSTTGEYLPRLWAYAPNENLHPIYPLQDGRLISATNGDATLAAPYNQGALPNGCYDGGDWYASQSGDTISVTVKNYSIDVDQFPTHFAGAGASDGTYGGSNVGMFSAGKLYIQQPFNKVGSDNTSAIYDVVNQYGSGTFTLTVKDVSLQMTSVTGATQNDSAGTNDAQARQDDDENANTVHLTVQGTLSNRVFYSNARNTVVAEVGVNNTSTTFTNGRDAAMLGDEVLLAGGFYYGANGDETRLRYGTSLLKFDADVFELTGAVYQNGYATNRGAATVLYATQKTAPTANWSSDAAMKNATEDDLTFYASLSDIPAGHVCVGALIQFRCPEAEQWHTHSPYVALGATIQNETRLINTVAMLTSLSRSWSVQNFTEAGATLDKLPDWTTPETHLSDFPVGYLTSWAPGYTKESYSAAGPLGTHTGSYDQGDSLLITCYQAKITKAKEQMVGSTEKQSFSLDADQRVVDFVLRPETVVIVAGTYRTTITVVDTLPKYLRYKSGSSYFGGAYTQTSANGGTQGAITGGTLTEPTKVVTNLDGTQTLTWIIPDVLVGQPMEEIHFSAVIGQKGNEAQDVPLATTSLLNTAWISGTEDLREHTTANGNYATSGLTVTRGSASSFAKLTDTPLIEPNGTAAYQMIYSNNGAMQLKDMVLVDTMPANGGARGDTFTGSYQVTSWRIDTDSLGGAEYLGNIQLYYTSNAAYANLSASGLKGVADAAGMTVEALLKRDFAKATIASDGTVTDMNGKQPVMWVLMGSVQGGSSVRVRMETRAMPSDSSQPNVYYNMLSLGGSSTTVDVRTVRRSLEGLTWLDKGLNGIREGDEAQLSGVKVTLLKLKEGGDPAKESDYATVLLPNGSSAAIETGNQLDVITGNSAAFGAQDKGRYLFTGLNAGIYAVRFETGSVSLAEYAPSPVHAQGSGEANDSDGVPSYSTNGELQSTWIANIEMPAIEDMAVESFRSEFHDSGFDLRQVKLTVSKTVSGNMGDRSKPFTFALSFRDKEDRPLADGTAFTVTGDGGIDRIVLKDGAATVTLSHGQSLTVEGIPYGYDVRVAESDAGEGYATALSGSVTSNTKDTGWMTAMNQELRVAFTNRLEIAVPTGILMDIWPYLLIVLSGLGGITLLLACRRRKRHARP